jgi:hypothetical protein
MTAGLELLALEWTMVPDASKIPTAVYKFTGIVFNGAGIEVNARGG